MMIIHNNEQFQVSWDFGELPEPLAGFRLEEVRFMWSTKEGRWYLVGIENVTFGGDNGGEFHYCDDFEIRSIFFMKNSKLHTVLEDLAMSEWMKK